jgi:multidrug efflux pump subunit AcrB
VDRHAGARRPYTFVVVALLIVVLGSVTMSRMPTDIFPDVDIPVASVVWSFTGISPDDMEKRVLLVTERAFTGSVNDIEYPCSNEHGGRRIDEVLK